MTAAETALAQAISVFQQGSPKTPEVQGLLQRAVEAHDAGLRQYDNWDYRGVLNSAVQSLSLTSQSLVLMGQGGKIYDPLRINPLSPNSSLHMAIDNAELERALKSMTFEHYKQGLRLLSAH